MFFNLRGSLHTRHVLNWLLSSLYIKQSLMQTSYDSTGISKGLMIFFASRKVVGKQFGCGKWAFSHCNVWERADFDIPLLTEKTNKCSKIASISEISDPAYNGLLNFSLKIQVFIKEDGGNNCAWLSTGQNVS